MDIPRRRVAATPRLRRGYSAEASRGDAAAATWIFRGDKTPQVPAVAATSAACSSCWGAYGLLEGDIYIWGPNIAGVVFSLAQGVLFLIFGCPGARGEPASPTKGEGLGV